MPLAEDFVGRETILNVAVFKNFLGKAFLEKRTRFNAAQA